MRKFSDLARVPPRECAEGPYARHVAQVAGHTRAGSIGLGMDKCRIACVRYLNTVPLIEGLEKVAGVELIPTVPSRIAGMVRSGEAEVGLCSVVDGAGSRS